MKADHTDILAVECNHDNRVSCSNCRLSSLCLPLSLELDQLDLIDEVVERNTSFHKGDYLFRAGEAFSDIFAVRAGSVKSIHISEEGEEQITGFYLPGEILGMDGLNDNHYTNSAIALETSAVCSIPFHKLEHLSQSIPSLQHHFFQLMSREIINEQKLIALLSKGSAEQRIASLLLSLSARHKNRQLSPIEFMLPMSRTDMGNYLGLTIETVSRVFSRLQKDSVIKTDRRMITLLNLDKLKKLTSN
jgi:CRP/FNR family transcriptional regulator